MRSFFGKFSLILFLYLGTIGKCACINSNASIFKSSGISHGCSLSCMKRSNPINYHLLVIFSKGIDEKNILFSYPLKKRPSFNNNSLKDVVVTNTGLVKYILSYSHLPAFQPEFISSLSFRAPPILY